MGSGGHDRDMIDVLGGLVAVLVQHVMFLQRTSHADVIGDARQRSPQGLGARSSWGPTLHLLRSMLRFRRPSGPQDDVGPKGRTVPRAVWAQADACRGGFEGAGGSLDIGAFARPLPSVDSLEWANLVGHLFEAAGRCESLELSGSGAWDGE